MRLYHFLIDGLCRNSIFSSFVSNFRSVSYQLEQSSTQAGRLQYIGLNHWFSVPVPLRTASYFVTAKQIPSYSPGETGFSKDVSLLVSGIATICINAITISKMKNNKNSQI